MKTWEVTSFHAIEEAIRTGHGIRLYINDDSRDSRRVQAIKILADRHRVPVEIVGPKDFKKSHPKRETQPAILICGRKTSGTDKTLDNYLSDWGDERSTVLLLDGITDPQNLGAIVRSADLLEVSLIVLPQRRSAHETETVARVSSGASLYVPMLHVINLVREISTLKKAGFWIYGADIGGTSISEISFPDKTAVVLGSEGRGIRRLVLESCDETITVPTSGHIDSLNVSVAAGIILYEIRRQYSVSARPR